MQFLKDGVGAPLCVSPVAALDNALLRPEGIRHDGSSGNRHIGSIV